MNRNDDDPPDNVLYFQEAPERDRESADNSAFEDVLNTCADEMKAALEHHDLEGAVEGAVGLAIQFSGIVSTSNKSDKELLAETRHLIRAAILRLRQLSRNHPNREDAAERKRWTSARTKLLENFFSGLFQTPFDTEPESETSP